MKPLRYLFWIGVCRQPKIIDLSNKFIAFKIANRLITANANPIGNLAMSEKLPGPVGNTLADQRETRHGNDDGLCSKCLSDPKCGKAFTSTAGHN